MSRSVSVVVPVKDGARYLQELLAAVDEQARSSAAEVDVLVIDSGSTDGSIQIAEAAGVQVLPIDPSSFGHGRTRNLGAERTTGDVVVFLTQDATPLPGWLDALLAGFALADDVGAVYGPHKARETTSPMIARELDEFFAGHAAAGGGPRVQRMGDEPFLSNVNAAYRRDCWEQIRFDDVAYAEDQAFARAMLAAGWAKVYHPGAAVAHAHDYPATRFMRRYFDEYRGLRETIGHVERLGIRSVLHDVRALVSQDRAWMNEEGYDAADVRRWTLKATVHHSGRKVFGALGSRATSLPPAVQKRISLEGTVAAAKPRKSQSEASAPPVSKPVVATGNPPVWDVVRQLSKHGPAPLLPAVPGQSEKSSLHVACVIPPFGRGSGGHTSILQIMSRLEQAGHTVSYWIDDELNLMKADRPARLRRQMQSWFAPIQGPVFKGFDDWYGADVVVATGWQTAHTVMLLRNCRARAYLIHDHESEFYPTSVESRWAEQTYGLGMHAICASPWLADIISKRYGGTTSTFEFGVDAEAYQPRPIPRRRDTVVLYGRDSTPRRAVPLALMALTELAETRPDLRVVVFGNPWEIHSPVPFEHLGVLTPHELSWVYSQATVGLVLSLTNYSLIPQEMLSCGLPCVDLAGISAEGIFGADGPVALSEFDPLALARTIDHLMTDETEWNRRSALGREFVAGRTWSVATRQVEAGLREALRLQEPAAVL